MAEVIIASDADAAGERAADEIAQLLRTKPDAVLGVATGSTPLTTWRALAARGLDLSRMQGFALDEYVGIEPGHPQSYRTVIDREVVATLGLERGQIHVPDPHGPLQSAADDYERAIVESGGVDLQILGIGSTGHLAFNEPGSSLASLTRVTMLAERTRRDNARFFDSIDDVPAHAITQGIGTILRARRLILLAFGEGKADAVAGAVEGPLTSSLPGSAIQLHPRVTVIVDEAAASRLARADYYRAAHENRPY